MAARTGVGEPGVPPDRLEEEVALAHPESDDEADDVQHGHASLRGLMLAALGVVYGDIGTSPLYTLREAFGEAGGLTLSETGVLGVLSLVFWSLILVVTLKYVVLILRADNRGEGGVMALGTLALHAIPENPRARTTIMMLAVGGLALFYGDGLITPAISVLSAVEGLETATPFLEPYVVPLASVVLLVLFLIQSRGTASVGRLFGPVMVVWFSVLGVLGLIQIAQDPGILVALNPLYAVTLLQQEGFHAFVALGAIVLAVTGAEALYADMGHFGRTPIRAAWLGLVLPGLVFNYFGQGALVLRSPEALAHPFYHMVPEWLLFPLIGLATLATIIASQAVISGVFSLTRQAIQLGLLPRMTVLHTSSQEIGQIYIPRINWLLMLGVLALVVGFGSSSNLAAAYGISVTGAMAIDAILAGLVAAWLWGWGLLAIPVFGAFLLIDLTYFAANALKIPSGGWFPLLVASAFAYIVLTWRRGREILRTKLYAHALTTRSFIDKLDPKLIRVPGTAVFMTGNADVLPKALLHNIKHNKVLHDRVVLMTVRMHEVPSIPESERISVDTLGRGFFKVAVNYGFTETPDVPLALQLCRSKALPIDLMMTSFFLAREILIASPSRELNGLEERLFIFLSAGALAATAYFNIPPDRVVELGTQVEI
jgi:KUP system potassium uptake protein